MGAFILQLFSAAFTTFLRRCETSLRPYEPGFEPVWTSWNATPVHPRSDLPIRLVATATLVVSLTGLAGQLGPNLSGLLNAFPVLTTIIAVFTHAQRGRAAMVDFLNGYLQSVVGFALFCVVMAAALPWIGLARALIAALAAQFTSHAFLLWRVSRAR